MCAWQMSCRPRRASDRTALEGPAPGSQRTLLPSACGIRVGSPPTTAAAQPLEAVSRATSLTYRSAPAYFAVVITWTTLGIRLLPPERGRPTGPARVEVRPLRCPRPALAGQHGRTRERSEQRSRPVDRPAERAVPLPDVGLLGRVEERLATHRVLARACTGVD